MSEALLRGCVERAEGNPLFLEHLLLNAGDAGAANLPGSIQALIQARMDWLVPEDKRALQAAAVLGTALALGGAAPPVRGAGFPRARWSSISCCVRRAMNWCSATP